MNVALVLAYLASAVIANLVVWKWGQPALVVTALVLVPIDMTARDSLNLNWTGRQWWKMAALIAGGSLLTLVCNLSAANVALASCVAFAASGATDWAVFTALAGCSRLERMNTSNVVSAIVDSVLFPLIAFGACSAYLSASQAGLKILGGALFSCLVLRSIYRD